MKQLPLKAIISSLLMLCFLFLALSGALLFFGKTGLVLGFSRYILRNAHAWTGLAMSILILMHVFLNRRLYLRELHALCGSKPHEAETGARHEKSQ